MVKRKTGNNYVEKYPLLKFYILDPLASVGRHTTNYFFDIMTVFGWWRCESCQKRYSPRVIKYRLLKIINPGQVCSKCLRKRGVKEATKYE
jgi:hypothetical protein